MAIDYGRNHVGIAITDPLCVISQPLLTLRVKSHRELIRRLRDIVKENNIGLAIVGFPLSLRGTPTKMSQEIAGFVKKLRKSLKIKVVLWDERFSSKYASNIIKDIGLRKNKNRIDQVVACIILDEYLKSQSECSA